MLCILNHNTDPYFNIAAEEHLLKSFSDDIFMLYRNEPSIVIGKHQNTFAEINYWFVKEKNIKVVRRLSGGGTVFHDLGNINFTFIQNGHEGFLVDFKRFTEPILQALIDLGVPAIRSNRNDLLIGGLKISGNAEHVYKNRVLHHGTLLFSSSLNDLKEGLQVNKEIYSDKAVKSVRSPVTNISNYLKEHISENSFMVKIQEAVLSNLRDVKYYEFSESDLISIDKLSSEKYNTWGWTFGYSPKFKVIKTGKVDDIQIELQLEVEKGVITSLLIEGDITYKNELAKKLVNSNYREDTLLTKLKLVPDLNANSYSEWVKLLL